jgi:hypothetical protein
MPGTRIRIPAAFLPFTLIGTIFSLSKKRTALRLRPLLGGNSHQHNQHWFSDLK